MPEPPVHSQAMSGRLKDRYTPAEIAELESFLRARGALDFHPLPSGLFSASVVSRESRYTGYAAVWVRDNVQVAHALHLSGAGREAGRCVRALGRWFHTQRPRLDAAIRRGAPPATQMERPHIRFDGAAFEEIDETWNHAQNDAIGYLLWLYCRFAGLGLVRPEREDVETLGRLALYLEAIAYWCDEDSGHWEEDPKEEASSIGPAVAGLMALKELLERRGPVSVPVGSDVHRLDAADLERLIAKGRAALSRILPAECVQVDAGKERPFDAALLFLIQPLAVVEDEVAHRIVDDVQQHLLGEHGVRRYLGDTFWRADYRELPQEIRTAPVEHREAWFRARGMPAPTVAEQAQWCLFDSILSAIYGTWHQDTGDPSWRELQFHHLNRSLGQLVSVSEDGRELRCPELFFLDRGTWAPNDVVPLLWAQANLSLALHQARLGVDGRRSSPTETRDFLMRSSPLAKR